MKHKIALALLLICTIASGILAFQATPALCTNGAGCSVVTSSPYAYTFGIKNSVIGFGIFILLALLVISHLHLPRKEKEFIIKGMCTIGTLIACYFLYLQQFVLHAYCTYCIIVDITLIIIALVLWLKE